MEAVNGGLQMALLEPVPFHEHPANQGEGQGNQGHGIAGPAQPLAAKADGIESQTDRRQQQHQAQVAVPFDPVTRGLEWQLAPAAVVGAVDQNATDPGPEHTDAGTTVDQPQ